MGKDPFDTQTSNDGAWVGVRGGHHVDTSTDITEIVIEDKENGDHTHIGIDADGNEVFRNDR